MCIHPTYSTHILTKLPAWKLVHEPRKRIIADLHAADTSSQVMDYEIDYLCMLREAPEKMNEPDMQKAESYMRRYLRAELRDELK